MSADDALLLTRARESFMDWHSKRKHSKSRIPAKLRKIAVELISSGLYKRSQVIKELNISPTSYQTLSSLCRKSPTITDRRTEPIEMLDIGTIHNSLHEAIRIEKGDGSAISLPISIINTGHSSVNDIIKSFLCSQ